MSKPRKISVRCYSGYTYPERPVSFTLNNTEFRIREIEKQWLEPGKRCFQVITDTNKSCQLCYNETDQQWSLTGLTGG